MEAAASVIAVLQLSAKVLSYLNDVKDSSKDRMQCAIEASNLHSLLLALRFRLEGGDGTREWYTAVRSLAVENGPLDQFKQALETLCHKMTDGGRLQKAGEALLWKFKKEEITKILTQMERLKSLIGIALENDHFKLSQALKQDMNAIRTHIPALRSDVTSIRDEQEATRHRMLLEWISTSDYPSQQSDIIGRRSEGTGQWFLSAPKTARWLNEAKTTLFCPGIPGAGKTMITAIAIQNLLDLGCENAYGVAYVYCNYKAQDEQDISSLLRAILKQLALCRSSTIEPIEQMYKRHANRGTKPSLDELYNILGEVVAQYPYVYIVVDALDECQKEPRQRLLDKLRDLQGAHDVRLMVTSRFIPEILDVFEHALKLEIRADNGDIKQFIDSQRYRLPSRIQRDKSLLEATEEKIVEASDGMFLLARLHLDSLMDKRTPRDVRSTLAKLKTGAAALDSAYKEALQRIEGQLAGDRELAKKVITWIACAKRPLTTAEICCALTVEPGDEDLDPDNSPDVQDLVTVCAGLVVVDHESSVIRLVHYTTQEYFEQIMNTWNPDADFDIVTTCLTYLSFSAFRRPCETWDELRERLDQNRFLVYAAKYLGEHAITVERRVASSISQFLLDHGPFTSFMQENQWSVDYTGTGLHWTAQYGLCHIAEELLPAMNHGDTSAIDAWDYWHEPPLTTALSSGQYLFAKFLLNKGADVNCGSALEQACIKGHEKIVELLLINGADINRGNMLQDASRQGHEQIVRLLLDKRADVNAQGRSGCALQAASEKGHLRIVELLLEQGANINTKDESYGDPLCAASTEGHEDVVKLLLAKGAKVNVKGGYFDYPLIGASIRGHSNIVKLLLDNGAEVDAEANFIGTALHAASQGGHEHIVELLIDHGANIDAKYRGVGDALLFASCYGREQVVRLLLRKSAEIDSQSIRAASSLGYKGITKLSLEAAATKNVIENGSGLDNAIVAASITGREQIVKLLLDNGADVNTRVCPWGWGKPQSCLEGASSEGHEPVVKLLLARGAEVDVDAIEAAESKGYDHIAAFLREKMAKSTTSEI